MAAVGVSSSITWSSGPSNIPKALLLASSLASVADWVNKAASACTVCEASAAAPKLLCESPRRQSCGQLCCSMRSSAGTCRSSFNRCSPPLAPPRMRCDSEISEVGERRIWRANSTANS